ncbi:MAG: carboxypeptidase-like regulatory domain-containing protein [Flavobacteriales bacterium]|nr:carboxypeptidase-like regulatory domain-containing protein [Flavobacteriales bacterium]
MRLFFLASILLLFSCHRSLTTTTSGEANPVNEPKQEDYGKVELTKTPVLAGQQPVLEGIVLDEQKMPFAFATVVILQNGVTIFGYTTDEDGHFTFKNLGPGEYLIEVRSIGYETIRKTFIMTAHNNIHVRCQFYAHQDVELKPVIYLYPEKNCQVNVTLNYQGTLQHTYPKYPEGGWQVVAQPDGTLYDTNGQEYYALFWEGKPNKRSVIENGFIIPGDETSGFSRRKTCPAWA